MDLNFSCSSLKSQPVPQSAKSKVFGIAQNKNIEGYLIDSDAEIQHAEFRNSFGKDAVYVRGGSVVVKESLFENAYKDGLDLDDGRAQISANRFVDCDDEAIDLSGDYHVEIFGNEILDARGGRVAAGQDLDAIRARNSFGYSQRSGARP